MFNLTSHFSISIVAIIFIDKDTAQKISKNKEMFALLGFELLIRPIVLGMLFNSISNFVLGYFLTFRIGKNMLLFSFRF
jgi:hypothetical protein